MPPPLCTELAMVPTAETPGGLALHAPCASHPPLAAPCRDAMPPKLLPELGSPSPMSPEPCPRARLSSPVATGPAEWLGRHTTCPLHTWGGSQLPLLSPTHELYDVLTASVWPCHPDGGLRGTGRGCTLQSQGRPCPADSSALTHTSQRPHPAPTEGWCGLDTWVSRGQSEA